MLAPPAWKKFFDANLIQISLTQSFRRTEYRNYICVQNPKLERDLKQIIIKVFGSRS